MENKHFWMEITHVFEKFSGLKKMVLKKLSDNQITESPVKFTLVGKQLWDISTNIMLPISAGFSVIFHDVMHFACQYKLHSQHLW